MLRHIHHRETSGRRILKNMPQSWNQQIYQDFEARKPSEIIPLSWFTIKTALQYLPCVKVLSLRIFLLLPSIQESKHQQQRREIHPCLNRGFKIILCPKCLKIHHNHTNFLCDYKKIKQNFTFCVTLCDYFYNHTKFGVIMEISTPHFVWLWK